MTSIGASPTWWVNQGQTFQAERDGSYVWAPQQTKGGGTPFGHWVNVSKLEPGDVIVHYAQGNIRALGQVTGKPVGAPRPEEFTGDEWDGVGWRAPVTYFPLSSPIPLTAIPGRHADVGPFTVNGSVKQGYLFALAESFTTSLRTIFQEHWPPESPWGTAMPPTITNAPAPPFDLDLVRTHVDARKLIIDDDILRAVISALRSGKHVVFTGPPGTAKTTLAEAVAAAAINAGLSQGQLLTTATSDWTTFETVGGLRPNTSGALEFAVGQFVAAIRENQWLVVDELNRSNFDRAFGQLFTLLSGQSVTLPYRHPETNQPIRLVAEGSRDQATPTASTIVMQRDWRLIATMNVFDKSLLFEMSFALMRRFAFIEVPAPPDDVYKSLIEREAGGPDAATVVAQLLTLRSVKELGPALFMDMARFATERMQLGPVTDESLTYQLFYSYLLPQFEGIDDQAGAELATLLRPLLDAPLNAKLRQDLYDVLGVELRSRSKPSVEPTDELDDEDELGD